LIKSSVSIPKSGRKFESKGKRDSIRRLGKISKSRREFEIKGRRNVIERSGSKPDSEIGKNI